MLPVVSGDTVLHYELRRVMFYICRSWKMADYQLLGSTVVVWSCWINNHYAKLPQSCCSALLCPPLSPPPSSLCCSICVCFGFAWLKRINMLDARLPLAVTRPTICYWEKTFAVSHSNTLPFCRVIQQISCQCYSVYDTVKWLLGSSATFMSQIQGWKGSVQFTQL